MSRPCHSRSKDAMHDAAPVGAIGAVSRFSTRGRATAGGRDQRVTDRNPCPKCGRGSWCRVTADGAVILCTREREDAFKITSNALGPVYMHHADGSTARAWKPSSSATDAPAGVAQRADPNDLDAMHRHLLGGLTLSPADREELEARGLAAEDIKRAGYRTMPRERAALARKIVDRFGVDLARRLPGVYWKDDDTDPSRGYHSFGGASGVIIPCRDVEGRVVSLKMRARGKVEPGKKRYTYVSSAQPGRNGPGPLVTVHVPAAALALRGKVEPLVITEGEFKADVSTALSGLPVVGIPGVGGWPRGVDLARAWGASRVAVALDADAPEIEAVARAQGALFRALRAAGFDARLWTWPIEAGKGLDDLLRARKGRENTR